MIDINFCVPLVAAIIHATSVLLFRRLGAARMHIWLSAFFLLVAVSTLCLSVVESAQRRQMSALQMVGQAACWLSYFWPCRPRHIALALDAWRTRFEPKAKAGAVGPEPPSSVPR